MLNRDPTFLGKVAAVSGASINVRLSQSVSSGLSMICGQTYRVGQVGSFVRIPQGYQELFGVVSEVGASAVPEGTAPNAEDTGRWMRVQLAGESVAGSFERGISRYPNVGDSVHLAIEDNLRKIYDLRGQGHVTIGALASSESIPAKIALNELVTRHSAVLGSTGSGKSTTVVSLLRAITHPTSGTGYPSARILMLDLHGEYADPLLDVADVYSVDPTPDQHRLYIPYWALDASNLLSILVGQLDDAKERVFTDKIFDLKMECHQALGFPGVDTASLTSDTPVPFSLKRLWYDLIDFESTTYEGPQRDVPARIAAGDPETLSAPKYRPHAMGSAGPFINSAAFGIRRQLNLLRSRMLDRRYDFLLHPGPWEPDTGGRTDQDLDSVIPQWLGGENPISILDLSAVPSGVLQQLIGSILKIVYESLFWSREKSEGGIERPLLVVMEEAHRYLGSQARGLALEVVQKIAKEGRKYGVGAMVISQRPSEVDETVLSQCGTFFALRLSNPADRARVQGNLPDGLAGLVDALPVLRTGEAIVTGEAAKLPMRCRMALPAQEFRPRSQDPAVSETWALPRRKEGYDRVIASWRAQKPRAVMEDLQITRRPVSDDSSEVEE